MRRMLVPDPLAVAEDQLVHDEHVLNEQELATTGVHRHDHLHGRETGMLDGELALVKLTRERIFGTKQVRECACRFRFRSCACDAPQEGNNRFWPFTFREY